MNLEFFYHRTLLRATVLTMLLAVLPALPIAAVAAVAAVAAGAAENDEAVAMIAAEKLRASLAAEKAAAAAAAEPAIARPVGASSDAFYQDLGGKDGITAIVAEFVAIMRKDQRVAATFDDVDMERLHAKLAEQFCVASGGPCQYTGKSMAEAHEDMKVNRAQFNASVEDLQLAMERRGVPSRIQNRLLARLAPTQRAIVTR
jgi:hemoglobin